MDNILKDKHMLACNQVSNTNPLDPEEFRRQGHMIIDFIADYYQNIEKHPVLSQVEPGYLYNILPDSAPNDPEPIETILQDVQQHINPGITHWQSPNFFAYFAINASVAAFLGDMLSSGFNIVGFSWLASPAATELESIVTDWLGKMLELPKSFLFSGKGGGMIQGTTCEAILCTLTAARDKKLNEVGRDNIGKLVVYGSDQTHSALKKAAKIVGIHPMNIRAIKTTKATSYQLSPDSFLSAISSDIKSGLIPFFFCATVGTTAINAVDPLKPLCNVAKQFGIWVHVDAAYAGSACICPEFRHLIDGIEDADSFSLNAHKWFLTNLDCCCLWLKDPSALTNSLSTYPEYLRNKVSDSKKVVDYKDWQIALSRRFRALKLWFVLRSYGVTKLRAYLRSHVNMAKMFADMVSLDKRFDIIAERNFAMVCFRLSPSAIGMKMHGANMDVSNKMLQHEEYVNEVNQELLESINATGKMYVTHAVVERVYFIRFAIGATLTEDKHVIIAWNTVQKHADELLHKPDGAIYKHK